MALEFIRPGICLFDAFTIEECEAALRVAESSTLWRKGHVRTPHGNSYNDNRQQDIITEHFASPDLAEHGKIFSDRCISVLTAHEQYYGAGPFGRDFFQYQRTPLNGRFMWHRDRKYAAVGLVYLTDEISHGLVGGGTAFDLDGEKFEIKPVRGKAVLFVGSLLHKGAIVRGGVKFTIVCSFYNPDKPRPSL